MRSDSLGRARWKTVFDTLLGEILLWLLIILLMAWSIGVVMIYNVTGKFANEPYDAMLANNVLALSNQVGFSVGRITINLPMPAREMLLTDTRDRVFFQVNDARGNLLVGDVDVPWIAASDNQVLDTVFFRDDELNGEDVRIAYLFKPLPGGNGPILVQVAETRNKRNGMAARIVSSVIVPQFAIVPLAVLLIYFAVSRGITPLHRLQEELRLRRPADLSAINLKNIPAEIRPLIEALNGTMARLDESLAGQRRFIADATHQLKTPLTGLRTQAEVALREADPERMRACIAQILQASERLADMTQKLLVLARAEAVTEQSALSELVDLRELVPEVAREWAPQAMERQIDLAFESVEIMATVRGSERLLHELFSNLLDNAIRYTPVGGHITIRMRRGINLIVEIEDSGVGIDPLERDKVFDRFYRVLGTGVDGSGLGLSIVKEIATLHHAQVTLHTGTQGLGTLVKVIFDLRRDFVASVTK